MGRAVVVGGVEPGGAGGCGRLYLLLGTLGSCGIGFLPAAAHLCPWLP